MVKEFVLGSVTFKVEKVLKLNKGVGLGEAYASLGLIKIAKELNNGKIPEDFIELTFYHELIHIILDTLGYVKLSNNEKFIKSFSLLLHQFMITKKSWGRAVGSSKGS